MKQLQVHGSLCILDGGMLLLLNSSAEDSLAGTRQAWAMSIHSILPVLLCLLCVAELVVDSSTGASSSALLISSASESDLSSTARAAKLEARPDWKALKGDRMLSSSCWSRLVVLRGRGCRVGLVTQRVLLVHLSCLAVADPVDRKFDPVQEAILVLDPTSDNQATAVEDSFDFLQDLANWPRAVLGLHVTVPHAEMEALWVRLQGVLGRVVAECVEEDLAIHDVCDRNAVKALLCIQSISCRPWKVAQRPRNRVFQDLARFSPRGPQSQSST